MNDTPPSLRLFPIADGICYGLQGAVFVMAYRRAPTAQELYGRRRLLDSLREREGGHSFMTMIDTGLNHALPSADTRQEMREQAAEYGERIRRGAYVLTGGGVFEPLLRTLMRGALTVGRSRIDHRFCATIPEAARFAAGEAATTAEVESLTRSARHVLDRARA